MNETKNAEKPAKARVIGVRHLQCFLLFWAACFAFATRVNLSFAIVAMTDNKSANPNFEEYNWSEKVKSFVLSSFFWGCLITQIPGGYVARRYGGKITLGFGIFISSIVSLVSPVSVEFVGWPLLLFLRVVLGLSQGTLFPSLHTILAVWTSREERAVLGTIAYSGCEVGMTIMFLCSGVIASSPLGWPGLFYVPGGLSLLWSAAWYFWGASSPEDCKFISAIEKDFINQSINGDQTNDGDSQKRKRYKIPWLRFLCSMPFWAVLVSHAAFNWTFYTLLTQMPTYMKGVLGFDIKSNAIFSAMPSLAMLVLDFVLAALDALITFRHWMSLTSSRKFFNTLSMWVPAAALTWLGFVDSSSKTLAVVLLVIAVGFEAAIHMGFLINHIDLSPNFAGIMLGCTNMVAHTMSTLAPIVVGIVVSDETNLEQWRIVFLIAACYCFVANLIYLIFGTANVQPWDQPEPAVVKTKEPQANAS